MKVDKVGIEIMRAIGSDELQIRMNLEDAPGPGAGSGLYFRRWVAPIDGGIPDDPADAWRMLQALVASINPPPVNDDPTITSLEQRLSVPRSSALVKR